MLKKSRISRLLKKVCKLRAVLFTVAVFLILPATSPGSAGDSLKLNLVLSSNDLRQNLFKKFPLKTSFQNESSLSKELRNILDYLWNSGYITATFDSLSCDSLCCHAFLNPGKKYLLAKLHPGNADEEILSSTGYRDRIFSNRPFSYTAIARMMDKILVYCENTGYPFAAVKLDSVSCVNETITASINLRKNREITIDSIVLKGDGIIAREYLYHHTGIRPGSTYNESRIKKLESKLNDLPFLRATKPPQVIFTPDETKIVLWCKARKASRFTGILGVLPNSNTTGKLLLTGDVSLAFVNGFHRGERIDFAWKKYRENDQRLDGNFNYPYLLNTPLGADFRFGLLRKDTTYLDVRYSAALQYLFTGINYIQANVEKKESNLISAWGLENATALPPYADVTTVLYGIGLHIEKLDYRFNASKGIALTFRGDAGNKTIRKNPKVNPALYQNLDLTTTQYILYARTDGYWPLYRHHVVKTGIQGGALISKNIFANELFRIGGFQSIRGFDEESILASAYAIATLEYRYLIEQNSYLFLFTDGAYYENTFLKNTDGNTLPWLDRPYGMGAGISFETKAGIFSISYAVGKQFSNPLDFRSAKIHFGLVNYF